jgi:hypothetical protein
MFKKSKHCNAKALTLLVAIYTVVGVFSVAVGHRWTVITSGWRPPRPGHPSFHPLGQAIDIRCNNKPQWWIDAVILIIRAFKCYDKRVQYLVHGEGMHRHIHVQFKEGKPI